MVKLKPVIQRVRRIQKSKKLKYLIFDIDGTLINTTQVDDKCYMNAFELVFGINIRETNWSLLKNVTDWGIAEELVQSKLDRVIKVEELSLLKETFVKELEKELATDKSQFMEIPGAVDFFKSLMGNSQFQIGIATGGWEESANLKLRTIGINPYEASYSNSNHHKSREKITQNAIDLMTLASMEKPTEIIYFGDGAWDYSTCKKLGIRFIGIDYKMNGKLKALGAKEVYQDFKRSEMILEPVMNGHR